jgi:RNA polymerase sigma-70 factor (sigma-E family)
VTTEAKTRDEQFRQYVHHSRGKLVRTATFFASGDGHVAEDLVQTALMRLYVAWPRVRPDTVDAYARKSMLNALIDNRRRPFVRHEDSRAELPEVPVHDELPSDTDAAVFTALADLPPRMRAAVVLRHLCELSVTETADALNCSEGTVKSQTARGLAHLRERLAPIIAPTAPKPNPATASPGLRTDAAVRESTAPVDLRHADATVSSGIRGSND